MGVGLDGSNVRRGFRLDGSGCCKCSRSKVELQSFIHSVILVPRYLHTFDFHILGSFKTLWRAWLVVLRSGPMAGQLKFDADLYEHTLTI